MFELALSVAIIVVTTGTLWIGSGWLEDASARLATYYRLPPVVQGGLIAAAGSSFPELASVIFAALAGSFGLGVGAIVGSAIFNILVIPALAVLVPGRDMESTRTLVHKETLFYLLSVVVLFLVFALALIYNPAEGTLSGELTRPLAVVPLAVYGLYLFLQWQDTVDYSEPPSTDSINPYRQWGWLIAGLLVILVSVEQLVDAVIHLGEAADTPDFLWGAVIVAAATSLPDALVSIQAADKEDDVASIANVVGSNIFDLLVVIPAGILLLGAEPINFGIAAPMMGCLAAATVLLFVLLRTELLLTSREAYVLLGAYVLFVSFVFAEAVALTSVLPN
ncbi:sodium:calcium antiporter [Halovenus sp. WSH3]|uniref:Sodium:calcium antiporter n=1 Tax=Halovenus carboxidivorans TaxID=2692199 RepID=A0A6B0T6M8_9EURY|nr:sodium:calcium antiporter [Halovenus carboxidivorans]MXR51846.1 sodium:calcium antiporter [Halovenus carboxidivorans]